MLISKPNKLKNTLQHIMWMEQNKMYIWSPVTYCGGRAVAQAVSRRLPTEPGSGHVGFVVGKGGTGAGFLRVFGFPLPIIPQTALRSSWPIIRGTIGQIMTSVPSGLSVTLLQESKRKNFILLGGRFRPSSIHKKKNSMVWVRERTIPTERPPLVGEVIANFCG
jgi:hypothetical protein